MREQGETCDCGNLAGSQSTMCSECRGLVGKREFAIGQKVRIIRRETWQGDVCAITRKGKRNPNMYWLKEHGWRRCDEIEPMVEQGPKQPLEEKDAEIERLRLGITTVRGCIIGALAGGHMEGNDGASYSKQVLLSIAETLGIDIPDIVKGEQQG